MKTTGHITLTLAILFGMTLPSLGQDILFNHLSTEDGLSQFTVNCLYVDENNVLWIGTRDGLNRYDGNTIEVYKLDKSGQNSLPNNNVAQLTGNKDGKIYIVCGGVTEYDQKSQKFTTLPAGSVNSIYYNDGLLITEKGLIRKYNENSGEFEPYYELKGDSQEISCMHINGEFLYIGTTHNGVYRLKTDKSGEPDNIIEKGNITCIYRDSDGELWIGSWEDGLYNIRPDGTIRNFRNNPNDGQSISSNFVRACCEDNLGNIWFGTFTGLIRYDKTTGKFRSHTTTYSQNDELSNASIWSIVKDGQGTIWVGTYFGGVNYFNPEYEIYRHYTYSTIEKQGLSHPVVGRIVDDKNGNLWIATEGGGLNFYNRKTREFKWFTSGKDPNSISHNNVKALYYNADNETIYIGTHLGGLNKLDIRTGEFSHYRMEKGNDETLPSDIVRDIEPYGDRLVVATQDGVCTFDPETGKCARLLQDDSEGSRIKIVADILIDKNGTLWLATTGMGLYSYRLDTKKLTKYRNNPSDPHSLSNNNVNNIMQDSGGNLWISTAGGGLDLYRPESDDFENFDVKGNGLGSDCIYQTVESPVSGNLLLITNAGFSIFDRKSGQVRNYGAGNGFPLTGVNENAIYVSPDGEIFLGGTHGMISFNETRLDFKPKPYSIILSRLFVNGKEIQVGDETGILKQALYCTPKITLHPDQLPLGIEVATSNYVAANKDDILYRMEGVSNKWVNMRGQNTITYGDLHAGTYHLTVRAEGKDEMLCPPAQLTICIVPPFHKTVLAYILYALIFLGIVALIVRLYRSRAKTSAEETEEEEESVPLSPDEELLARAKNLIEEHLDDTRFNVTAFAHEMGISRTSLFTKIKALTGQTPNDFILTIRLDKAAFMLRNNPELNISDISDRTGFSLPRYFSKCFKDMYHVSPLAYRKNNE